MDVMETPKRQWQMTKLDKSDYLLPSNDRQALWRIFAYDEDGSAHRVGPDGEEIPVLGRFWACAKYNGVMKDGRPVLLPFDYETFLAWSSWDWWDSNMRTRQEAIDAAMSASQ